MRNPGGGLEKYQTPSRVNQVYTSAPGTSRKRDVIESRILAAKRELEAPLAAAIAVAGPLVATSLGKDGHDIYGEFYRMGFASTEHAPTRRHATERDRQENEKKMVSHWLFHRIHLQQVPVPTRQ